MPTYHTLTLGATTVQIPRGLVWSDEFDWTPVDSVSERGITGALIVDAASKTAGRPITLASIGRDQGHISRSTLLALLEWLEIDHERVVTAGDTLNDLAMFETGLKGVMVGNAEPALVEHLPRLPSVYRARGEGCSGIAEGLHHFGFDHLWD